MAVMARSGVDERILATAHELLRSRGPGGVSIESVSTASGVAKTTIYRRFDNSEALVEAVVAAASRPVEIPAGLEARETVRWALGNTRDTIEHVVGRGAIAAVLGGTDPRSRRLLLAMIRATIGPFRDQLRQGVDNGQLRADLDIELVISVLTGAVIAEMIRERPTDDAWVDALLRLLWPVIAGAPSDADPAADATAQ